MRTLVIALSLPLSGFSANQVLPAMQVIGNVFPAAQQTLVDEKVVYAAELLYNIPAQAYVVLDMNEDIPPAIKPVAKAKLIELNKLRLMIINAKGTVNCEFGHMQQ